MRRALISVSDKTGIVEFARALAQLGVEMLSTGGTHKLLAESGIAGARGVGLHRLPGDDGRPRQDAAPEGARRHPRAARRGRRGDGGARHRADRPGGGEPLPVRADRGAARLRPADDAIENIDIGGPTMVRAAAKNHRHVGIVVDAADYARVLAELRAGRRHARPRRASTWRSRPSSTPRATTARSPTTSARWTQPARAALFPRTFNLQFAKAQEMRYGENPHQHAAFYVEHAAGEASIATAQPAAGQGTLLQQRRRHRRRAGVREAVPRQPACVIVKHANPCGVAVGGDAARSLRAGLRHRHRIRLRRHHRLQPRAGRATPPARSSTASSSK